MRISKKNRNLLFFIVLTLLSFGAILYFTADSSTFTALRSFNIRSILILFLLWGIIYSFDALAFYFMVVSGGEKISYADSYRTSALKTFFMMITPLGMGVTPALIYYLSNNKIPGGKSSSTVLTKVMINALWILLGALLSFFLNSNVIMENIFIFIAFVVTCSIQIIFVLLIILMILFPHYILGFLIKIGHLLSRFKILKRTEIIKKYLVHEASVARRSFRLYFKKHILTFIAAVFSNGIAYFATLSVLYFVIRGLGQDVTFLHTLTFTALMIFIIGFLPTPGGSGLAEILFVLILSKSVPVAILGVAVVIWRFFIYYISVGIGLSLSFRYLSNFIIGKRENAGYPSDSKE